MYSQLSYRAVNGEDVSVVTQAIDNDTITPSIGEYLTALFSALSHPLITGQLIVQHLIDNAVAQDVIHFRRIVAGDDLQYYTTLNDVNRYTIVGDVLIYNGSI